MKTCYPFSHFLLLQILIFFSVSAFAQAGTLDSSFGINGKLIDERFSGYSEYSALQKDGKIILSGSNFNIQGITTTRYNNDGAVDLTFGNNGIVTTVLNGSSEGVALQSDGKILVMATVSNGNTNVIVIRYNINGSIDSSFAANGVLTINFSPFDIASAILVQPDNRILILDEIDNRENDDPQFALARYLPDGSVDNDFGDAGKTFIVYQNELVHINSLALQPDGKILIGGADEGVNFFAQRFLSNGYADTSFGVQGKASCKFVNMIYSSANDIKVTPDNRIVVVGETQSSSDFIENMTTVRFTSIGTVDSSFNKTGIAIKKFDNNALSAINSASIQNDKKIICAGRNYIDFGTNKFSDFTLLRYDVDGTLDSTFGNNGIEITSLGYFDDVTNSLLQSDGKIIVTGSTNTGSGNGITHFALARYLGDNPEKYVHIKHWLHRHGITWEDKPDNLAFYSIERSSNGNAFTEVSKLYSHNNQTQFSYEDYAPLSGTNYYRLRIVSNDGSIAYSNVVAITDETSTIKIYPNPAQNNLQVEGLSATTKTKLTVIDFSGNIKTAIVVNSSSYNLNISQLKQGNYILRIETNGNVVTRKFVKQ